MVNEASLEINLFLFLLPGHPVQSWFVRSPGA